MLQLDPEEACLGPRMPLLITVGKIMLHAEADYLQIAANLFSTFIQN